MSSRFEEPAQLEILPLSDAADIRPRHRRKIERWRRKNPEHSAFAVYMESDVTRSAGVPDAEFDFAVSDGRFDLDAGDILEVYCRADRGWHFKPPSYQLINRYYTGVTDSSTFAAD